MTSVSYTAPAGSNIPVPGAVSYEYDAAGNRESMSSAQSTVTYSYDTLSLLRSETRTFAGLGGSYTLSYDYNLAGGLKQLTDPFGAIIDYNQDHTGRVESVTGSGPGTAPQFITGMRYRAWGAIKEETYGNNYKAAAEYDARPRVSGFSLCQTAKFSLASNR